MARFGRATLWSRLPEPAGCSSTAMRRRTRHLGQWRGASTGMRGAITSLQLGQRSAGRDRLLGVATSRLTDMGL